MIRMQCPPGLSNTVLQYPRSLDQNHPYLRSGSVCLSTATKADAAEIAAQKRTERRFVAALVFLALCAAPFIWS